MNLDAVRVFQNFQRLASGLAPLFEFQRTYQQIFGRKSAADPWSVPAAPTWNVESDPNIPRRFKQIYRGLLSGNAKGFKRRAAQEYLKLAKEHFADRTPVTKGEWWERARQCYREQFGTYPSGRMRPRLLRELGLESLPENPSGRRPSW
jgi:hypothetical protein